VYGGLGDFHFEKGDQVLIFGAGPVGLSFVKLGKLFGLGWIGVVDLLPAKLEKARALGADATFTPDSAELANLVKTLGRPLDAVVDAVGSPKLINRALPLVKLGGAVCVYGVISDESITIDKAKGPMNFNLYMHQWPTRRREREAQQPLCEWIRQGKLSAKEFVTHEFGIGQVNDALKAVASGQALKCLLRY
jgi:threonine dehydrogenase-like Zn-dependent dehydrogenase